MNSGATTPTEKPARIKSVAPRPSGPLIVVKRTEEEFAEWAATEVGFLTTFGQYGAEDLKFDPYQLSFLRTNANYRCVEKSRQVGYSFIFACEALARSHLRLQHTSVFVSYNLADAKEKIAYCQQMHEELPLEYQKKMVTDSKLELAFQSNDASRKTTRIISNPSKAPRGKTGDIYLDELAHCSNDREIYKGSTALIIRSRGQLTVCSSPLGRRGTFWELARQEIRPYKAYWRQSVPWWLCGFFCKDIHTAAKEAPKMTTAERVERFGKKGIQDQFDSLLLEDFQQEFEVFYSDETLTFFPYELILPCTNPNLELYEDVADMAKACKGRLIAGFDVGRKRDFSELVVFEEINDGTLVLRYRKSFDRIPFEEQEGAIRTLLQICKIARMHIDNTGIGMNLVENLEKEFAEVVPAEFTMPNKEVWCNDFKIRMQKKMIEIPRDRDMIAQVHSIKKIVTPAGRVIFDVEHNTKTKGHADLFWAMAIAAQKERTAPRKPAEARALVIG